MIDESNLDRPRPTAMRELLEQAKEILEPVTKVDSKKENRVTRFHAIEEEDGVAYRATIVHRERADGPPSVKLSRSYWDSDSGVMRDWSSMAIGRMNGPRDLRAWESIFTVFNAALAEFREEVDEAE